jgi:hypothetical protein
MRHNAFRYFCDVVTPNPSGSTLMDDRLDDYTYYSSSSGPPITPDYGWAADQKIYTDVAGTTLATADDDAIAAWGSFGNNADVLLTQSTVGQRPVFKKAVFGSKGKDAIRFTAASNQFLWHDSKLFSSATGAVFGVIQFTSAPNNAYIVGLRGVTDILAYWGALTESTTYYQYYIHRNNVADGSTEIEYSNALNTDTPWILAWTQDGTGQELYQNAVLTPFSAGSQDNDWTANIDADRTAVGALYGSSASGYYNGYISEVLIYESTLTDAEVIQISQYLVDKYGTT